VRQFSEARIRIFIWSWEDECLAILSGSSENCDIQYKLEQEYTTPRMCADRLLMSQREKRHTAGVGVFRHRLIGLQ
jgi:hypothetical protein